MGLLNRITAPSIVVISFMFRSIIRMLCSLTVGFGAIYRVAIYLFKSTCYIS